MATKHYNKEIKNLSKDELVAKLRQLEADIFQARLKKMTGQLDNKTSFWKMRKDVARMKMLLSRQIPAPAGNK
ncbi:MAG: 50S ribosomal protein L29 [Bdellovibrionales bacterium RIFOXYD1_FULL_53_11]|nr:MAG: 50S ribosomal protein L29 [Bdellovibrionales bacterium RIFOXYD1_FULL_53_11]